MARAGGSVPDLILFIRDSLGQGDSIAVDVVILLRKAFHLEIREAKPALAWSFFEGGTWTADDVDEDIRPHILARQASWDRASGG